MDAFLTKGAELLTQAGGKIIVALLVFIIGRLIIKAIQKLIERSGPYQKLDPTLKSFFSSFIKILLNVILVIAIISVLGIPMASVITVLATCGVAIGLALQGSFSNLAGGIMLMIFKPFRVGDFINAAGEEGVVKDITLFYTVINTVDNKRVSIPNGSLMNANVSNYTVEDKRRVDLTFNIGAANDIADVQKVMLDVCKANPDVINDPAEPFAAPVEGVPGGLKYTVRAWTTPDKYWDVYFALMKGISAALGENKMGGPLTHVQMENK